LLFTLNFCYLPVFYIILLALLLLHSCKTVDEEKQAEGLKIRALEDLSLDEQRKLGINIKHIGDDGIVRISYDDFDEDGNVWIHTHPWEGNSNYILSQKVSVVDDPICALQSRILDNPDSVVIITPNPTSSAANIKLFSNIINRGYELTNPVKVDFQLLYNQRIIHQWSIDKYYYTAVSIPADHLKETGTYLLICSFTGPKGCIKSYSSAFMVIKN